MNRSLIQRLAGLALALALLALSEPPRLWSQQIDIRERFREFYLPRWPDLQRSYSNIRFRCALVSGPAKSQLTQTVQGSIGLTEFTFDLWPSVRLPFDVDFSEWSQPPLAPTVPPEKSGGWIDDYSFLVSYGAQRQQNRLQVFHDQYRLSDVLDPWILAPVCSVQLRQSYRSIVDDEECQLLDFLDRRLRTGQRVMTLFYRPPGVPQDTVFEADFDPVSGACLGNQEATSDRPEFPIVMRIKYAADSQTSGEDNRLLPAPLRIDGNFTSIEFLQVLSYQRVGQLALNELSVTRYGFEESETRRPQTVVEQVTNRASHVLLTAGLVLVFLFLFVAALIGIVSLWARVNRSNAIASGRPPGKDLSELD